MPRPLRLVLVGLGYLVFGGFGAVIAYILLPLRLLGVREPDARIDAAQDLLHVWSRRYFRFMSLLGILRAKYPDISAVPRDRGAVVIANHPSLLDVVFLMAAVPRLTYVAKASWLKSPLVGRLLQTCGHIAAGRDATAAEGALALERMVEVVRAGRLLLVFPEGTRSPRHEMWPLRRGAFEAAKRADGAIVALVLRVDPAMLLRDQPWHDVADRPIAYEASVLDVIAPDAIADTKAAASRVEARYRAALGLPAVRPEIPAVDAHP